MFSKKASKKDIKFILANLRVQDKDELKAKHGDGWRKIVYKSIRSLNEEHCFIGCTDDKKPVLMYGIAPCKNNVGSVWMLATQDIVKEQISFLKQAKEFIFNESKKFKKLCNFVHSKNTLAIKWLKWLGFEVENPKVIGLGKKEFLFFYKESNNV